MTDSLMTINKLGYIISGNISHDNFFIISSDDLKKGDTNLTLPRHIVDVIVSAILDNENRHLNLPGRDPIWVEFYQPEEVTFLWNSIFTDTYCTATFRVVDVLNYLDPDAVRKYLQTTPKG